MSYINAIVRDASGSISSTQVPEPTLDRAMAWAEQHFDGCEWGKNSPSLRSEHGSLASGRTITLVRHSGPRPEIVVTRQPMLADIMLERGLIDDMTPVVSSANRVAVRGKHVLGLLPNYLSALAASITEIPMRLTNEDYMAMQRGELSPERARAVTGDPVTYRVERILDDGADQ